MLSILDSASSFSCTHDYTAKNQGRRSKKQKGSQNIDVVIMHRVMVLRLI